MSEVLVLRTPTRLDPAPMVGRRGIEIQNLGPYPIYCSLKNSLGLAVNMGRRIDPGAWWAIEIRSNIHVYGVAETADQVTGAATIVTETV